MEWTYIHPPHLAHAPLRWLTSHAVCRIRPRDMWPQSRVNQTVCEGIKRMLLASVAPRIDWVQLATVRPNEGKCSNCFHAMESLNAMNPWRLLQDSTVYFTIFIFHEFSLAWLCKTLVPINDLPRQRRYRKLIWAHLQTLWRPRSLIRFQRGFWGGRHLWTERGKTHRKTSHRLIHLPFRFNIAHSECSFSEGRLFTLNLFLVNEGNLLNSISSFFLGLSVEMPVGFERYTTSL